MQPARRADSLARQPCSVVRGEENHNRGDFLRPAESRAERRSRRLTWRGRVPTSLRLRSSQAGPGLPAAGSPLLKRSVHSGKKHGVAARIQRRMKARLKLRLRP